MPDGSAATLAHRLRHIAGPGDGRPDAELLAAFAAGRDPTAFEAIVRRHGPMVLGVCRRVTGNHADADDAFQAAFLVLVHKARAVAPGHLLGPWLHGVAYRTAMKAKSTAARRRAREARLPDDVCAEPAEDDRADLTARLDRAIQALPERYRLPLVLCELQGLSYRDAAGRLGVKEGTLAGRLSRARGLLGKRLRHGVGLAAVPLAAVIPDPVTAAVPAALLRSTVAAANGSVSPAVAALTHGVLTHMLLTKLRPATVALALGLAAALVIPTDRGKAAPERPASDKPAAAKPEADKSIDESLADPNLHHPRVWLELKLSSEQRDEIDRLLDADEVRHTELLKEMFKANQAAGNPQAAAEVRARSQMRMMKLPQETALAIQTKVLKPDQAKRLRQIALQAKGPGAFLREDVKAALKYSTEQEERLAGVVDGAWDRIRIMTGNETASEAYVGAVKTILEGLTKEQQKAWDALTGKPFPMPAIVVRKMLNAHAVAGAWAPVAAPPPAPGGFVPVPGVALPPVGAAPPRVAPPLPAAPGGAVPPPAPPKG
jgi:RNA polymerase sigma factor (sigma-70 family)